MSACGHHGRVTLDAGRLQPAVVVVPELALVGAQMVEIVPGEQAALVAIGKHRLDRVIANRLQFDNVDLALAGLQDFLPRSVALHFGRR